MFVNINRGPLLLFSFFITINKLNLICALAVFLKIEFFCFSLLIYSIRSNVGDLTF